MSRNSVSVSGEPDRWPGTNAFRVDSTPANGPGRYVYFAACGCTCWRWIDRCCHHGATGGAGPTNLGKSPCGLCAARAARARKEDR